jgi:hypothetical protein
MCSTHHQKATQAAMKNISKKNSISAKSLCQRSRLVILKQLYFHCAAFFATSVRHYIDNFKPIYTYKISAGAFTSYVQYDSGVFVRVPFH